MTGRGGAGARASSVAAAVAAVAVAACGGSPAPAPPQPASIPAQVVAAFERATLAGPDAWATLFDFAAIGEFEILLHRYDLLGRLPLSDALRAAYLAEDGTPYPAARERRNVGNFYELLAQRTVGTGGCHAGAPRWKYNQLMGLPFPPLPPGHESHAALRTTVNAYLEAGRGGVVAIRCDGGRGGLALVWSKKPSPRGWDIVTIYDDGAE